MESPLTSNKRYQRVSIADRYDESSNNKNINATPDRQIIHQLGLQEIMEQKKQQQLRGGAIVSTTASSVNASSNENENLGNNNLVHFVTSSEDDDFEDQRQRRRNQHHHSNDASVANSTGSNLFRHKSFNSNQQDRVISAGETNNNTSRSISSQPQHSRTIELVGSTASSTGMTTSVVTNKIPLHPRYQDNPISASSTTTNSSMGNEHHTHTVDDHSTGIALKSATSPKTTSPLHPPRNIVRTPHNENNNFADENSRGLANVNNNIVDSDWELDDDDDIEPGLRRYNQHYLEYAKPSDIPMPAEFTYPSNISDMILSIANKIWIHFIELRTAARQRRAARLLTMPSESWRYQLHACLLTWFCDETDAGILLLVSCSMLWILLGIILDVSSKWWTWGLMLFIFRITARRMFELIFQRQFYYYSGSSNSSNPQTRSGISGGIFRGIMNGVWLSILGKPNAVNRSRVPTREADSVAGSVTQSNANILNRYAS